MKENQNPKIALNILLCSVLNIISLLHKGCFPRPCHKLLSLWNAEATLSSGKEVLTPFKEVSSGIVVLTTLALQTGLTSFSSLLSPAATESLTVFFTIK